MVPVNLVSCLVLPMPYSRGIAFAAVIITLIIQRWDITEAQRGRRSSTFGDR